MSNTRVKAHPYLNIWAREDGCIFLPRSGTHPARWTFGSKTIYGYLHVKIAGKNYFVHRLVAETYLGQIQEGMEVDHLNRVRDDNRVDNLRIVTKSKNRRNTAQHDRVTEQGRTHLYEDENQYNREQKARYRAEHPEKVREQRARYKKAKRKTHKIVRFADGSEHYIPHEEADALLAIPWKQRVFHK